MKNVIIRIASLVTVLTLMLTTARFAVAQVPASPPATPPQQSEGKATGGVIAHAGDTKLKLAFNAHGGDEVKGNVLYTNSNGDKFWGKVDLCYTQEDNSAAFAGTVRMGNTEQDYFLIEVQDNGEGKKMSSPDALRVRLFDDPPACNLSGEYPGLVDNGNLQVH